MISRFLRVRFRPLSGSRQECYYKLMALGVPYFALPVTQDNKMLTQDHVQLMNEERRKLMDSPEWQAASSAFFLESNQTGGASTSANTSTMADTQAPPQGGAPQYQPSSVTVVQTTITFNEAGGR
mmetsp:Transcript_2448/g.6819  ORF Transcript_2448/g.6819 Transcript_2448/m.6819 type:complete len:125 (-) Transcript_2448:257-631(-)